MVWCAGISAAGSNHPRSLGCLWALAERGIVLAEALCRRRTFTLVVSSEFYALRLMGIPFGPTAILLVAINLPTIYLIWKRRTEIGVLHRADWLVGAAALVIPLACVSSLLTNIDARIYSGHSWVHADAIYMFARGYLVPEDPNLAGFRLSYPVWAGLVLQGVHSYLANSPPVCSYIWTNLVSLIAVYGFAIGITKEMGGGRLAQASCGVMTSSWARILWDTC